MGCRCADRRTAIADGARAVREGDLAKVADRARFVGRTMVEDARRLAALAAARSRLSGRR